HCAPVLQGTHVPVALHTEPPPWVHGVSVAFSGFDGELPVHTSSVHWLPSTGLSFVSATLCTLPAPSHTFFLQSPVVCDATAVLAAGKPKPHAPAVHFRVLHSSSVPGHSLGAVQPVHAPPTHASPLPHPVPSPSVGFDGTPFVHTSSVHGLLSTGLSVL